MELASPKTVEFLEEWEVKRFWNDSAKDSTPQQLNSHLPVEEIESGNVGNPFPEIIDENRKSLNGYELLKQAFPIKKLEKAKPVDMLCVGYPRDTFTRLKQALNQALILI